MKDVAAAMTSFEQALGQFMRAHQHKAPVVPTESQIVAACRESKPQIPTKGKSQ